MPGTSSPPGRWGSSLQTLPEQTQRTQCQKFAAFCDGPFRTAGRSSASVRARCKRECRVLTASARAKRVEGERIPWEKHVAERSGGHRPRVGPAVHMESGRHRRHRFSCCQRPINLADVGFDIRSSAGASPWFPWAHALLRPAQLHEDVRAGGDGPHWIGTAD